MDKKIAKSTDEYIERFPAETQQLLQKMRLTIKKAAPEAVESISYGMPTFTAGKNKVYFAGYKNHIGFYPGGAIAPFKEDLSAYKTGKGGVQFALDKLAAPLGSRNLKARLKPNLRKKKEY